MRACARAPSAMLMTSTPPPIEHLRGGERLRGIEPDRRVDLDRDDESAWRDLRGETRSSRAVGTTRDVAAAARVGAGVTTLSTDVERVGSPSTRGRAGAPAMRAAAAMRRTCSGVVPQQPPTSRTPSLNMRRAKTPKYSGVET